MMDDLESIRKKKIQQLQRMQQKNLIDKRPETDAEQQLQQFEGMVKQRFTREALQRYGNLKTGHPEKALQLLLILAQAIKQGNIDQVDDNLLKQVLLRITPEKKEFNIRKV